MTAKSPQSAETKVNNRWFRFSKWALLVSLGLAVALLATYVFIEAFWFSEYRRSWTEDYDKERYARIRKLIDNDPEHLRDKPFDEVSKELSLDNIPWDVVVGFQEPPSGQSRVYHFRGFFVYVELHSLPLGLMPNGNEAWTSTELERHEVLWLGQRPSVRIDGIRDQKERMEAWRKCVPAGSRRILGLR